LALRGNFGGRVSTLHNEEFRDLYLGRKGRQVMHTEFWCGNCLL